MSITFTIANRGDGINFSSANAAAMLRLMGAECAEYGDIAGPELDRCIRLLLRIANDPARRAGAVQPSRRDGRFHDFGATDESVARRAAALLELMVEAGGWGSL